MSDYTNWHVGMKVVCVKTGEWEDDAPEPYTPPTGDPQYGEIYTISEIDADDDGVFVALCEIDGWTLYYAPWFRPVQTRKTDISIFTAMLTDKREPIDVRLRKELV